MQYQGSCHCGKVKFSFQGEFGPAPLTFFRGKYGTHQES